MSTKYSTQLVSSLTIVALCCVLLSGCVSFEEPPIVAMVQKIRDAAIQLRAASSDDTLEVKLQLPAQRPAMILISAPSGPDLATLEGIAPELLEPVKRARPTWPTREFVVLSIVDRAETATLDGVRVKNQLVVVKRTGETEAVVVLRKTGGEVFVEGLR